MDQLKTGRYIAEKRKALGMTQVQLAEKLGMSDKSVSKWERGVCLPDVSVYQPLCDILGITVNEFIAGEDIREENISKRSDENIILVSSDAVRKRKKLMRIIALLTAAAVLISGTLGYVLVREGYFDRNYVIPLSMEKDEMRMVQLMSGAEGSTFRFSADKSFHKMAVCLTKYEKGEMVSWEEEASFSTNEYCKQLSGTITFVQDKETGDLRFSASREDEDGYAAVEGSCEITKDLPLKYNEYGAGRSCQNDKIRITSGEEIFLGAFSFDTMEEADVEDDAGETEVYAFYEDEEAEGDGTVYENGEDKSADDQDSDEEDGSDDPWLKDYMNTKNKHMLEYESVDYVYVISVIFSY